MVSALKGMFSKSNAAIAIDFVETILDRESRAMTSDNDILLVSWLSMDPNYWHCIINHIYQRV